MSQRNLTLLTDLYELTMMQGYFKEKDANETVIFDAFYRTNPGGNGYAICAGLEQVIQYIKDLHFEEDDVDYLRSVSYTHLDVYKRQLYYFAMCFQNTGNLLIAFAGDENMIHHLKTCFLTHGLNLADQFADETFLDQLRCQVRVKHNRNGIISFRYVALHLSRIDQ